MQTTFLALLVFQSCVPIFFVFAEVAVPLGSSVLQPSAEPSTSIDPAHTHYSNLNSLSAARPFSPKFSNHRTSSTTTAWLTTTAPLSTSTTTTVITHSVETLRSFSSKNPVTSGTSTPSSQEVSSSTESASVVSTESSHASSVASSSRIVSSSSAASSGIFTPSSSSATSTSLPSSAAAPPSTASSFSQASSETTPSRSRTSSGGYGTLPDTQSTQSPGVRTFPIGSTITDTQSTQNSEVSHSLHISTTEILSTILDVYTSIVAADTVFITPTLSHSPISTTKSIPPSQTPRISNSGLAPQVSTTMSTIIKATPPLTNSPATSSSVVASPKSISISSKVVTENYLSGNMAESTTVTYMNSTYTLIQVYTRSPIPTSTVPSNNPSI